MPDYDDNQRSQTYGEKLVRREFNPAGDDKVDRAKRLVAELIDLLNDDRADNRDERARLASVAITEAEGVAMRAVKALTEKREDQESK